MKRYLSIFFATLALLSVPAQAIHFATTNVYAVSTNETLAEEQWIYTKDAEVNGHLKNDLFLAAANQITLGGTFDANVWGTAANIKLTGKIKRNARLAAQTVQISGHIGGNLIAVGNTLKVAPTATLGGNLKLWGNSIILEGTTQGDVSITASRVVTLSGTINGNVTIVAPEIIVQRNTRIDGNLTYTANKELVPAEGIVAGKFTRALPPATPVFSLVRLQHHFIGLFATLLVGMLLLTLFPMTMVMSTQTVRAVPWRCLWVGALCLIILPVLALTSLSSRVGIPLGILTFGIWLFMAYSSQVIMGLVIGSLILRRPNTAIRHIVLSLFTGLAIIYLLTAIPAIAFSMFAAIISMGSGSIFLSLIQRRRLLVQPLPPIPPSEEIIEETNNNQPEEK